MTQPVPPGIREIDPDAEAARLAEARAYQAPAFEARQVCSVHGPAVAAWCGGRYDDVLHQVHVPGDLVAGSGEWVIRLQDGTYMVATRKP